MDYKGKIMCQLLGDYNIYKIDMGTIASAMFYSFGELELNGFEHIEKLLSILMPKCSLFDYNHIKRNCYTYYINTSKGNDSMTYISGTTNYKIINDANFTTHYYTCDLSSLYDILIGLNCEKLKSYTLLK